MSPSINTDDLPTFDCRRSWIRYSILVLLGASCGKSGNDPMVAVCDKYSSAICGKVQKCSSYSLSRDYGSYDYCVTLESKLCTDGMVDGSNIAPAWLMNCADTFSAANCADVNSDAIWCRVPAGSFADGSVCKSADQCASLRCSRVDANTCGVCKATTGAGQECGVYDSCADGFVCDLVPGTYSGKCVALVARGDVCNAADFCEAGTGCRDGTCQPLQAPGEACEDLTCQAGLFCGRDGTCMEELLGHPGDACGGNSDVICVASAYCDQETKKCMARAGIGEICGTQGPFCAFDLECQDGKCEEGPPLVCM